MGDSEQERAERAPPQTPESPPAHAVRVLAVWVVLAALWLPLTFPNYLAIYLLGAAAAAIAAVAADVIRTRGELRFTGELRWLRRAWRLPWAIARDTATVFGALWRRLRGGAPDGGFRSFDFPAGGDDERGTARRAVAEAAASAAPNTFALGVDRDTDTLPVHQLVFDDGPPPPDDPLELR